MAYPSLRDDGNSVVLDLHGATVDEAVHLAKKLIGAAAARGRASVKIIHGSSTTGTYGGRPTIKSELHALIDANRLHSSIASTWFSEDYMVLSLPLGQKSIPTPLTLLDLQRL